MTSGLHSHPPDARPRHSAGCVCSACWVHRCGAFAPNGRKPIADRIADWFVALVDRTGKAAFFTYESVGLLIGAGIMALAACLFTGALLLLVWRLRQ